MSHSFTDADAVDSLIKLRAQPVHQNMPPAQPTKQHAQQQQQKPHSSSRASGYRKQQPNVARATKLPLPELLEKPPLHAAAASRPSPPQQQQTTTHIDVAKETPDVVLSAFLKVSHQQFVDCYGASGKEKFLSVLTAYVNKAKPPLPMFPSEVVTRIAEHLADDPASLVAMGKVCKQW